MRYNMTLNIAKYALKTCKKKKSYSRNRQKSLNKISRQQKLEPNT